MRSKILLNLATCVHLDEMSHGLVDWHGLSDAINIIGYHSCWGNNRQVLGLVADENK